MANSHGDHYQELLEAVKPFFPNDPIKAHAVVTEKIGPIFNDVLLQLIWKQLELENGLVWIRTMPYEVILQRFNMN